MRGRPLLARWAAAGLVALLLVMRRYPESAFYPACPFYSHFHMRCPGCGATRALLALLHGRVAAAWHCNQLFVAVLPVLVAYMGIAYWRGGWPRLPQHTVIAALAGAVVFAVVRNLPGF